MVRCSVLVTVRDPYKLPPNTSERQCRFRAIGRCVGQLVCQRHLDTYTRQRERARQKQLQQKVRAESLERLR